MELPFPTDLRPPGADEASPSDAPGQEQRLNKANELAWLADLEDGVWQISFDDAATRSVLGLKASACTALAKLGFGERYWWEN